MDEKVRQQWIFVKHFLGTGCVDQDLEPCILDRCLQLSKNKKFMHLVSLGRLFCSDSAT
jgi:hypothetical protein